MNKQKPWIIGHRGARGLYPENSLIAFSEAVRLGVNGLEMDIQITFDGKVVVAHDPVISPGVNFERNTSEEINTELIIYKTPYSKIRKCVFGLTPDAAFPEQKKIKTIIPLLSEVIETSGKTTIDEKPLRYFLEIKSTPGSDNLHHPPPVVFASEVLKIIQEYNIENQTYIISFDERILTEIKKQNETIKTGYLFETPEKLEEITSKTHFHADAICPLFTLINQDLLEFARKKNIPVFPWTVNENEDLAQMLKLQVAGIITDYPDRALALVNEDKKKNVIDYEITVKVSKLLQFRVYMKNPNNPKHLMLLFLYLITPLPIQLYL